MSPGNLDSSFLDSSPAFLMMYSAYKLNKLGDNIQPWRTPFLIWNQSVFPYPVPTVASWPAYRLLRRQVRWSGIPISLSYSLTDSLRLWSIKSFQCKWMHPLFWLTFYWAPTSDRQFTGYYYSHFIVKGIETHSLSLPYIHVADERIEPWFKLWSLWF